MPSEMEPPRLEPNRPLSVEELTTQIKSVLEPGFSELWVRGEVSNLRRQSSGHVYFTLKDRGSQISAVMFRRDALRQPLRLRDGMEIVVFASISLYVPRGQYQLVVRLVVEEGVGQLQRRFAALKEKLGAEGLFDSERKRPLPEMPATVVVITSSTGAALRDFLSILERREWGGVLRLLSVRVQGEQAAGEIVGMLERANRENLGDLIVLTRGGGSLEDLWPFNEEAVARAVAASRLPVISAVGHEIDFTLSDFAADRRAETPSAAAELISSPFIAYRDRVRRARRELWRELAGRLQDEHHRLQVFRGTLRAHSPQARLEQGWMRLDDLRARQASALQDRLHRAHRRLGQLHGRFWRRDPATRLETARGTLSHLSKRLVSASPASALSRGYAIVRDDSGRVVDRLAKIPPRACVSVEFEDGQAPFRREERATQSELSLDISGSSG